MTAETCIPQVAPPAGFVLVGYSAEPDGGEGFRLVAYAVGRGGELRAALWEADRAGEWGPWAESDSRTDGDEPCR